MLEKLKLLFETEYSREQRKWVKTFEGKEIKPVTYFDIIADLFKDHTPEPPEGSEGTKPYERGGGRFEQ